LEGKNPIIDRAPVQLRLTQPQLKLNQAAPCCIRHGFGPADNVAPWTIALHRFFEVSVGIIVALAVVAIWREEEALPGKTHAE
jgi:hypothetical protein